MKPIRKVATAVALICAVGGGSTAMAASEADKQVAIDAGLSYLAGTQKGNGAWTYDNGAGDVAATGAVLLAFLEEGHTPTSGTAYSSVVADGLSYVLGNARQVGVSPSTKTRLGTTYVDDPDSNGNGYGIKFNTTSNVHIYDTYNSGIVVPALVKAGATSTVINGTGNSLVDGKTYGEVIQDTVDYLAYGQVDSGVGRGGWRYYQNYSNSDNSVSQWPALGLLYAESASISAPQFVKDELDFWTHYSQDYPAPPGSGGAGYTSSSGETTLRTGSWLVQANYDGYTLGDPDPTVSGRVQAALDYIDNNWSSGWTFNDYYGMWAVYKGLELMIGLDDMTEIGNLRAGNCGGDVDNPHHNCNWWEDLSEQLVFLQNASGNWTGGNYGSTDMKTAWAVNILQAVEIPSNGNGHEHTVPEPGSLALLAAGLLGVGAMRRRRPQQV